MHHPKEARYSVHKNFRTLLSPNYLTYTDETWYGNRLRVG